MNAEISLVGPLRQPHGESNHKSYVMKHKISESILDDSPTHDSYLQADRPERSQYL